MWPDRPWSHPSVSPPPAGQVFWALGTVFEVLLAVFVMPTLGWRWLLILSAAPLLLFAVLCVVGIPAASPGSWGLCSRSDGKAPAAGLASRLQATRAHNLVASAKLKRRSRNKTE